MCVYVSLCVRVCIYIYVCARVRACMRACIFVSMCVMNYNLFYRYLIVSFLTHHRLFFGSSFPNFIAFECFFFFFFGFVLIGQISCLVVLKLKRFCRFHPTIFFKN